MEIWGRLMIFGFSEGSLIINLLVLQVNNFKLINVSLFRTDGLGLPARRVPNSFHY